LGYFVRTRIARLLDWSMSRVPGVTIVYQSIRDIFQALDHQRQDKRPQRVVLVPFPHPGARALALVTKTLRDAETQKTILCVYVVTALMPPAGFTLFIPEEEVTEVAVTPKEAFQIILSGGLTAPPAVPFSRGSRLPAGAGPIVDTSGRPIEPPPPASGPSAL